VPEICFVGLWRTAGHIGRIVVMDMPLFNGHRWAGSLATPQESILRRLQVGPDSSHSTGRRFARLRHRLKLTNRISFGSLPGP